MLFKVLVCGGRKWKDLAKTYNALAALPKKPDLIIHGGAKGADMLSDDWAVEHGVHTARVNAMWLFYGTRSAGPIRNGVMLAALAPDYCVAFPGGTGTGDMIKRCEAAGVPVWRPYN